MSRSRATALPGCVPALLLVASLLPTPAQAQITLLEDAETVADSSEPGELVVYDGALYFAAKTAAVGRELFRYENGEATLVGDLRPGPRSSEPTHLTVYDDHLVFGAEIRSYRLTPYAYDFATGALRDLSEESGLTLREPEGFVEHGGRLFFSATDGTRRALYRYHTDSGVEELLPDSAFGAISGLAASNGALVFSAEKAEEPGVRRLFAYTTSRGEATRIDAALADFTDAVALGSTLYLAGDAGDGAGDELHVYDPLTGVLTLAADVRPGEADGSPRNLTVYGGRIYFSGADAEGEPVLYQHDPATGETARAGADGALRGSVEEPSELIVHQDRLYFNGHHPGGYGDLYVYDRLSGVTARVADLTAFGRRPGAEAFRVYDGALYFAMYREATGYELYRYDGSEVVLAADLAGTRSSFPTLLGAHEGALLYAARLLSDAGYLRAYDPATGLRTEVASGLVRARPGVAYAGRYFFSGLDTFASSEIGYELYAYDGATGAVSLAADVAVGEVDSSPSSLTVMDGLLYFVARTPATGHELFVYDAATGTAELAAEVNAGEARSHLKHLTAHAGKLYFAARTDATGDELFVYDPQVGEITLLIDSFPGRTAGGPNGLLSHAGNLYLGIWGENGVRNELHAYDPMTGVLTLVADVNPGAPSSNPEQLVVVGDHLAFVAWSAETGYELFAYDFATESARLVADLYPGPEPSSPQDLVVLDDVLYFSARSEAAGRELFRFDPEVGRAELVEDLEPGATWSDPAELRVLGGSLYFRATTTATGYEMWRYTPPGGVSAERAAEPSAFRLSPPAPNPASHTAHLTLHLGTTQRVAVAVYDVLGRAVLRIASGPMAGGQAHRLVVDTSALPAGVYFVRAQGEAFAYSQPLTVVR